MANMDSTKYYYNDYIGEPSKEDKDFKWSSHMISNLYTDPESQNIQSNLFDVDTTPHYSLSNHNIQNEKEFNMFNTSHHLNRSFNTKDIDSMLRHSSNYIQINDQDQRVKHSHINEEFISYLNGKDYNLLLEIIMKFYCENNVLIKRECLEKIDGMLKFQISLKQYQNLVNLISSLFETKKNSYYSDPLQSFYHQELLNLIRNKEEHQHQQDRQHTLSKINSISSSHSLPSLGVSNHHENVLVPSGLNDWSLSANDQSLQHRKMIYNQDSFQNQSQILSESFSNSRNDSTRNYTTPNLINNRRSDITLRDEIELLSMSYSSKLGVQESDIERAATLYRNSATAVAQRREATYQWTGRLNTLSTEHTLLSSRRGQLSSSSQFSRKVFLGGVPWDSTEDDLCNAFGRFGPLTVAFPHKELNGVARTRTGINSLKGYCYLIFESEDSVNRLLTNCNKSPINGGDYFRIGSSKFRSKEVQVIPWVLQDSQSCLLTSSISPNSSFGAVSGGHNDNTMRDDNKVGVLSGSSFKPDSKRTVFIGALHGMITASGLARIMNDLFDNVVFAALDTDKYKYPIGSGRVTFSSQKSYMRAVTANFVHIKTQKFSKTIQIDPYLEDSMCNNCFQSPGIYFCRSFECFRYFCSSCWQVWHNRCETLHNHKPLRRTFKPLFECFSLVNNINPNNSLNDINSPIGTSITNVNTTNTITDGSGLTSNSIATEFHHLSTESVVENQEEDNLDSLAISRSLTKLLS